VVHSQLNYYSLKSNSEFFIVSETALWKRLTNMKRLDILTSRKISTCNICGNTRFSIFSEFCGICGNPLRNRLNGFKRVYYPQQFKLDRYRRVLDCPFCKMCGNPTYFFKEGFLDLWQNEINNNYSNIHLI
jgi:ribosomal protein L37E